MLDHLTDEQKPGVAKKLNAAYSLEDYAAAKQALNMLHRELMDLNPSVKPGPNPALPLIAAVPAFCFKLRLHKLFWCTW
jgi:hypothetical protein